MPPNSDSEAQWLPPEGSVFFFTNNTFFKFRNGKGGGESELIVFYKQEFKSFLWIFLQNFILLGQVGDGRTHLNDKFGY